MNKIRWYLRGLRYIPRMLVITAVGTPGERDDLIDEMDTYWSERP